MTEHDAIRIARSLIDDQKIHVGKGARVVNLESHLAACDTDSGQAARELVRADCTGRFVVWFEIPHASDEVLIPDEIGVQVDSRNGQATFL